jgi:signal transduction histidine kinase
MNSASIMKRRSGGLARCYQTALRHFLKQGPAASAQPAEELGRQAVRLGLETLDLALIHEQALIARVLPSCAVADRERLVRRAGTFFAEAILPLEETHRSASEANVRLSRANEALNQRTVELAASNRNLKKEIVQRQAVEENLRQSEQHSSRLLEQSRRQQEQLRHLSHKLLSAQEEERKRISRELHDVIAQVLTGIHVQLANLKTDAAVNTQGLTRNISRTQRLVEKSVDIVHRFARELRPAVLDDLGLVPALHSHLNEFAKRTSLRVHLTTFTAGRIAELDSARRTVLYRVAQEALNNVARHAQASRVEVSLLRVPHGLRLQIKDDGKSFRVEHVLRARKNQRLGLVGMRERVEMVGGEFTVESAPGHGTAVQAQIPCRNGQLEGRRKTRQVKPLAPHLECL